MCARYKADEPEPPSGGLPPRQRPRRPAEAAPLFPEPDVSTPPPPTAAPPVQEPEEAPLPQQPSPAAPRRKKASYWHVPDAPPEPAAPAHNPWQDISKPPPKGTSVLRGLWLLLGFPFRMIFFLTRNLPGLIMWPLRIIVSFGFVGMLFLVVLACVYTVKAGRYDITQVLRMPERSLVLDRTGLEIGTLHGENRRSIESLDEVPQYFIDAIVLQEDRSYWEHGGVDPRGVMRAVAQVFKHGRTTQGASTITMQLAKNTYNHSERNFDAKLTEVVLARRIEATYDKNTILKCYINRVFWGHTYLGLKQAAYGYFSKEPNELTVGEAAMLAGIVCNPNEFSPLRNPEKARIQRDKVLLLLRDFGKIDQLQYELALQEPIITNRPEPRGFDNYSLDLIRSEVDHILTMLDANGQRVKEDALYSGGLIVRTTLDLKLQDDVMHDMDAKLAQNLESVPRYPHQTRAQYQALVQQLRAQNPESLIPAPKYVQGACVIIDNATGALLAVVGGRDSGESPLNRALQSRRQVGSLFKPLVYSTFFERGGSPSALISDARLQPGEIPGAKRWSPRNADGRYLGYKEASWGLLKSRNTMSVRVGARAGLANVENTARLAGFADPPQWRGPTIYLGTWEASPLEVATAYTTYANGGVRPTPYIIESITDSAGKVIWQNVPSATTVMSRKTANDTSAILQKITKKGGTAANVEKLGFKAPCGGKTGTTNAYKNAWFCGFTSDLTAAVWVGFDRPVTIADKAYGGTVALPLWVGAMQCAQHRGYVMRDIRTAPAAARTVGLRLCRDSGQLAHSGCEAKRTAYTETMADLTTPRELCSCHLPGTPFADDDDAEVVDEAEPVNDDGFAEEPEYAPLFKDDDDAEVVY
ncbi:MAG: hypothetical protein E7033_03585 [Akkermansiaceae bacterium]|nr:hypothetical protein [Akkermansiaceae bacterium]